MELALKLLQGAILGLMAFPSLACNSTGRKELEVSILPDEVAAAVWAVKNQGLSEPKVIPIGILLDCGCVEVGPGDQVEAPMSRASKSHRITATEARELKEGLSTALSRWSSGSDEPSLDVSHLYAVIRFGKRDQVEVVDYTPQREQEIQSLMISKSATGTSEECSHSAAWGLDLGSLTRAVHRRSG